MKTTRTTESQGDAHASIRYQAEQKEALDCICGLFDRMSNGEKSFFLRKLLGAHPIDELPNAINLGEIIIEARELRRSLDDK